MLKVINPANGKHIADLEEDTADSIADKFARAKAAQRDWSKTNIAQRKAALARFSELLVSNKDSLALTLTREMGKPIGQARNEIGGTCDRIAFFLEHVEEVLRDDTVYQSDTSPQVTERISHEPWGVIANISAWNYPYFVGSNVFVPALLTGNTVLYKPSEFSSMTGMAIADLLHSAGIPRDVFIAVIGGGPTGAALLQQPVGGVFFTGSYATGVKIAQACAPHLRKVQLELGGKDPTYVCEDVDIKAAAEGLADGAFYNTGQSCCSVERIYVNERIYKQFVEHFVTTVRAFNTGSPEEPSTYIGPLTRGAQITVLEAQVKDATARGGKLLCGGKRIGNTGSYFEPTVISDANNSMALMREESFGPIIGIASVSDDVEAVKQMNDTDYGLTAGIYSRAKARAELMMAELQAGSVYWNCCDRVSPRLPWTGRKHSGMGSTLSVDGLRTFLQPKAWHLKG